ncbi:hypothetical protein DNK48_22605 [Streptomyces malaysiensis subsp. malaysiensis]|nr:hypothetical protein DNK48_22605 [Streptomyces malaysiensis]
MKTNLGHLEPASGMAGAHRAGALSPLRPGGPPRLGAPPSGCASAPASWAAPAGRTRRSRRSR